MALPVLDGNQTATTLSSVVTGGEHIVAHSVVSLGANAIANITSAVSGSVVSVSNFPASQSTTFGAVTGSVSILNFPSTQTIAGTVTANVFGLYGGFGNIQIPIIGFDDTIEAAINGYVVPVQISNASGTIGSGNPLPISGAVTANVFFPEAAFSASNIASDAGGVVPDFGVQIGFTDGTEFKHVSPSVALPVSGTVTIGNSVTIGSVPNGLLTTRFGTPTTANTAFATSAVTNANRKYLLIQNVTTGSNVITVGIGFTPTTTQGIQLTAGAGITFESSYIPTGAVQILSSVTASNFTILEA